MPSGPQQPCPDETSRRRAGWHRVGWRRAADRPVLAALAVTALLSALFLAVPELDLAVTRFFHGPDGFEAAADPRLVALRLAGRIVTRLAILGLVVLLLAKFVVPARVRAVPLRALLFLAASLALGPGLVVNLVLKQFWHRPRPADTDLFGGAHPFGLPWIREGACLGDCSFPSGESSAAIWLVAFAFVVPPRWRRPVALVALVWAAAISANRIAFGGHYLSDVLIAWSLTLAVVLALRGLVLEAGGDPPRPAP